MQAMRNVLRQHPTLAYQYVFNPGSYDEWAVLISKADQVSVVKRSAPAVSLEYNMPGAQQKAAASTHPHHFVNCFFSWLEQTSGEPHTVASLFAAIGAKARQLNGGGFRPNHDRPG